MMMRTLATWLRRMPASPSRRIAAFSAQARRHAWHGAAFFLLAGPCASQELVLAVARSALSLPVFVADSQGYFAAEGVAVRTVECVSGRQCLQLLLDGRVQLATAGDLPIMLSSFERSDYAILATFVSSSRDLKLVTRKSSGITAAKHFEGRRVATVKGTTAHYFLDSYFVFNDVDAKKVNVVALSPEQMAGALERKEVDAVAIWEPFAYLTTKAVGADAAVLPTPRIYSETFNLITDRPTSTQRQGDLVKVLRAMERGQRFIREQPKRAQSIMLERIKVDPAFVDWAWNDLDYRMSLDQSLLSMLEGEARWALREGHVAPGKRMPDFLGLMHPEPLRQALPSAVTFMK